MVSKGWLGWWIHPRSCGEFVRPSPAEGIWRFLQQYATLPLGKFSKENIERRFRVTFKERYATAGLDAPVPVVRHAEDILIAVIGGAGKHSAFIPTFGATRAVTRALKRKDGQLAMSVEEFRLS